MEIKTHITNKKLTIKYQEHEGIVVNKQCIFCLNMLTIENFSNLSGSFLGKKNHCKKCECVIQKKLRETRGIPVKQPKIMENNSEIFRECSKCEIAKSINEFNLNKSGYFGHDSECKECKSKRLEIARRNKGIGTKREVPVLKNEEGVITHRECSRCSKMLELCQFNKHGGEKSTAYLGIHPYCKECSAERHLISKYGITMKQKKEMINEQNNSCKICNRKLPEDKLRIDHCHASGKIRGILCDDCNVTLGLIKENIQTLENMIEYLKCNGVANKHGK